MEQSKKIAKIAAQQTKKLSFVDCKSLLKAAGLKQTLYRGLSDEIESQHKIKNTREAKKHRNDKLKINVHDRLSDFRLKNAQSAFNQAEYRQAVRGDTTFILSDDPEKIGVRQEEYVEWDVYGGKFKSRPARVQNTYVTVPARWVSRVQKNGLSIVDGIFTLDAAKLESNGCDLFAVKIVTQGRGTSLEFESCYLARLGDMFYHGVTAEGAIAGLKRKIKNSNLDAYIDNSLNTLPEKLEHKEVTIKDAESVGACLYGIKSWCNNVGINFDLGVCTLKQVFEGYKKVPATEAKRVLIKILRKHRFNHKEEACTA